MYKTKFSLQALCCPCCHSALIDKEGKLKCTVCGSLFSTNKYGFIEFILDKTVCEIDTTTEEHSKIQESSGARVFNEYIKPLMIQEPVRRVLDVGCGIGKGISTLIEEGYEAYGIDLPSLSKFWNQVGNKPQHFFCCNSTKLPFPNNYFDFVYSLGVIEHIGTETGQATLSSDYQEVRQQYANEILRVTKPNGRILIACPNKSFPIDIQHGPGDSLSPKRIIRNYIYKRFKINIHAIWGKSHLLNYPEMKRLFSGNGVRYFEPLPLKNYFGFIGFKSIFIRLATAYINNLPKFLRASFLNPYMLVLIRK